MGRHRLDHSAARHYRGAVMFTADEYERVQGAAAASSRTLSSWRSPRKTRRRAAAGPQAAGAHRDPPMVGPASCPRPLRGRAPPSSDVGLPRDPERLPTRRPAAGARRRSGPGCLRRL